MAPPLPLPTLSPQASLAAACYAVLFLATQPSKVAAAVAAAAVAVYAINCYVVGGCHWLAWAVAALLAVTAGGAAFAALGLQRREDLVVRGEGRPVASEDDDRPFAKA